MRRPALLVSLTLLGTLVIAGCGGGATHTVKPSTSADTRVDQPATPVALEQAVRTAVNEDHRLAVESLWTNRVPTRPAGIAGPALSDLRQSVAQRRKQGLRVRTLSDEFRIVDVQLDPSYTTATATVTDAVRVQPSNPNGQPRGKASATREHAQLELRRVGNAARFVVWKVTLLP